MKYIQKNKKYSYIFFLILVLCFLVAHEVHIYNQSLFGVKKSEIEGIEVYYGEEKRTFHSGKDFKSLKDIENIMKKGQVSETGLRVDIKFSEIEQYLEKEYKMPHKEDLIIVIRYKKDGKIVLPAKKKMIVKNCDGIMLVFNNPRRVVDSLGPGVYLSVNGEKRFSKSYEYFQSLDPEITLLKEKIEAWISEEEK